MYFSGRGEGVKVHCDLQDGRTWPHIKCKAEGVQAEEWLGAGELPWRLASRWMLWRWMCLAWCFSFVHTMLHYVHKCDTSRARGGLAKAGNHISSSRFTILTAWCISNSSIIKLQTEERHATFQLCFGPSIKTEEQKQWLFHNSMEYIDVLFLCLLVTFPELRFELADCYVYCPIPTWLLCSSRESPPRTMLYKIRSCSLHHSGGPPRAAFTSAELLPLWSVVPCNVMPPIYKCKRLFRPQLRFTPIWVRWCQEDGQSIIWMPSAVHRFSQ